MDDGAGYSQTQVRVLTSNDETMLKWTVSHVVFVSRSSGDARQHSVKKDLSLPDPSSPTSSRVSRDSTAALEHCLHSVYLGERHQKNALHLHPFL